MRRAIFSFAVMSAAALALAISGSRASASVSLAVTFETLLHDSSSVSVATPTEARAVWENGRIVTYTHLHVDRSIAGNLNAEPWVASLGGIVGNVGQVVDGEPTLHVGVPYLLFLRPDSSATTGTYIVTARAQGQFQLKATSATSPIRAIRNPGVGEILPRSPTNGVAPKAAADMIADRAIDDVAKDVAAAWGKAHAR